MSKFRRMRPGVISFDDYWPAIKSNGLLKSDVTISRVVGASGQLEEIIDRSFAKAAYKPMAKQIIYALSVHRLLPMDWMYSSVLRQKT